MTTAMDAAAVAILAALVGAGSSIAATPVTMWWTGRHETQRQSREEAIALRAEKRGAYRDLIQNLHRLAGGLDHVVRPHELEGCAGLHARFPGLTIGVPVAPLALAVCDLDSHLAPGVERPRLCSPVCRTKSDRLWSLARCVSSSKGHGGIATS